MTEKDPLQLTEPALKNFPIFQVDEALNAKTLKMLENRRAERAWTQAKKRPAPLRAFWETATKKLVGVLVMVALVMGGVFYAQNNSYAYHLDKAKRALVTLETILHPEKAASFSWIESAHAQGAESTLRVDEPRVIQLTLLVLDSTEKAIDLAQKLEAIEEIQKAFEKIFAVQAQTVETLGDAVTILENEDNIAVVVNVLSAASEEQVQVENAIEVAAKAKMEGKKIVKVEVKISKKMAQKERKPEAEMGEKRLEFKQEAEAQLKVAKERFLEAKMEGKATARELETLQSKIDKGEAALKTEKYGRAKGLGIAVEAKTESLLRIKAGETKRKERMKLKLNRDQEEKRKKIKDERSEAKKIDEKEIKVRESLKKLEEGEEIKELIEEQKEPVQERDSEAEVDVDADVKVDTDIENKRDVINGLP